MNLPRYLKVFNVLLVVIAILGIYTYWIQSSPKPVGGEIVPPPPSSGVMRPGTLNQDVDFETLKSNNIFLPAQTSPSISNHTQNAAPQPSDRMKYNHLELLLTVAGDPTAARAVIRNTKTDTAEIYRIGDRLLDGTIAQIHSDHLVIQLQNAVFTLSRVSGTQSSNTPHITPSIRTKDPKPYSNDPHHRRNLIMEEFLEKVTLIPEMINGQPVGLKVQGLEDFSQARFLKIKDGDIIQQVNGQTLTGKQKAYQVFRKARTQNQIEMQVRRGNSTKTFEFKLK